MKPDVALDPPYLCVYRTIFMLERETTLEFDYSADERCQLFCDGGFITSGPERGTVQRWFSNHVTLRLESGIHCLTAAVYCFGHGMTAYGQMSIRHGFWIQECGNPVFGPWKCQLAAGCTFVNTKTDWASYPHILTDEDFNWEIFSGKGGEWHKPVQFKDTRLLEPGILPSIISREEITDYGRAGTVFLFQDYVTVWGEYEFSGTGEVRLRWVEPGCDVQDFSPEFLRKRKPGDAFGCSSGPGDRFRITGKRVRWNDYFWPKIITNKDEYRMIAVGLVRLYDVFGTNEILENMNVVMSGALISMVPILILFVIFQKYMLSGFTKASMK